MRQFYIFYTDAFFIAFKSILEHKLRAFLTLLGVIIGVASVIVVSASISGLNSYVMEKITKVLGANHFMINRMAHSGEMDDEEFELRNKRNKKITWEEYKYIKEKCTSCTEVGAQTSSGIDLNQDGIEMPSVRVQGVTANMALIEDKTLEMGRFISDTEVEHSTRVCVIGTDVVEKFFPNQNPIGQDLKVSGLPLKVIGVEKKRGSMFGQALDRNVYMPISLQQQLFERTGGLQVHGSAGDREALQIAIDDARLDLRNKRKLLGSDEDTFGLVNTADLNKQVDSLTAGIAVVVLPITMITLIVGGIVVMNIMLVSVTERTFEVGLRKALGATRKQILLQFLIESALLCVLGGIIGILLGATLTSLVTYILEITMTVTAFYIIVAVGVSSIIGIIAGLYPAFKASKLDPIVALSKS